jgi:Holliday junction resolvasome RuvABC endonuclease subunit
MVKLMLGLREALQPDAADALAAALCHAHSRGPRATIQRAAGAA